MRDKKQQRRILKRSKKQEDATAADLQGQRVIGSGNIQNVYMKEDAVSEMWLVQCKFTDRLSYSITLKDHEKLVEHAQKMIKNPAWRLDISGTDLAVIDWNTFVQLLKDAGWINDE